MRTTLPMRLLALVSVLFPLLESACLSQSQRSLTRNSIEGVAGVSIGEVTITPAPNGIPLRIETKGLPPG